jgi:formamidopyrimidine-DNA glycosylase
MPELPDIIPYQDALQRQCVGRTLVKLTIRSPFLLRTFEPPPEALDGRTITGTQRLGKRLVLAFEDDYFAVIHLMIAGRLRWRTNGRAAASGIASFEFDAGTLWMTEAGRKKRAALHLVRGADCLSAHDPGGADVRMIDLEQFEKLVVEENHTLKRLLTDPRRFDGIGNAYSDEILHRARLSPVKLSQSLTPTEIEQLHEACGGALQEWIERRCAEVGDGFPEKVTAFHPGMAVHGRFGEPCPVCGEKIQRIVYAEHETNYCPGCQTNGRILADRSLSRLLKSDWPRHIEDLA